MVVDDAHGFVESLNWETQQPDRDARLRGRHHARARSRGDGRLLRRRLGARRTSRRTPDSRAHLVPRQRPRARRRTSSTGRKHSLWVQNERYQDTVIIERLVRAARRGVKVHIIARPPHTLKAEKLIEGVGGLRIMQDVGAKVHKLKDMRLHGKMMLADGERAIVGSINLAPGSFDARRELAIEVDDKHVVGAARQGRRARLGALGSARPDRRGPDGRPREARQGRAAPPTSCSTPIRRRSSTQDKKH